MEVLDSRLDPGSAAYAGNRAAMLERLATLDGLLAEARAGGGERSVARHRARGKLGVRERIELLLDPGGWFLELSPLAAWGTDFPVGASMVTGIGLVSGVECLVAGNDPTVRGGALNPWGVRRWLRASEIAAANRLPVVQLVESGGADLQTQADTFVDGGRTFYDLARLSAAGIPTVAVVFGNATAGGAYIPGMSDYAILIRERSKVFLGGPPLVKVATGEDTDDETLGGGELHATRSGLADHLAADEPDALRAARDVLAHLGWRKLGPAPALPAEAPIHDPEELLGLVPADPRQPFDAREVLARVVDGSRFEEFKPLYGRTLVTGWAAVHGYRVGVLANNGALANEEAEKATQFIGLANQTATPLLFLQNTTGYVIGTTYERRGIVKHGANMVRAVSTSTVPHITLMIGGSWGAGNYGMSGRAYSPRFVFTWPNHRIGVMGPRELAGVVSIVGRAAAEAKGIPFDAERDQAMRAMIEGRIEHESSALYATGRLWDDGVIDPRDTRTVLGIALSAAHSAPVTGGTDLGPVRM